MAPRAPSSAGRSTNDGRRPSGKTGRRRNRDARRGVQSPPGNWSQVDQYTMARDDGRAFIRRALPIRDGRKVWYYRAAGAGGDAYHGPAYVAPWRPTLAAAKWDAHELID